MIRLRALLALPILAAACAEPGERAAGGGSCPAGETCSDDTPYGLYFLGTPRVGILDGGPATTAIGGTQEITIERESGSIGNYVPFTLPFVADDDGGLGVKVVSQTGAAVSVRGVATRSNYLRILSASDGELYDRKMIDAAAIDTIRFTPGYVEGADTDDFVWFIGEQTIGIALLGQVQGSHGPETEHLVDTSMTMAATGSDRTAWDTLHFANAQAGIVSVHVEAGDDAAQDLPLEFVDHADAIAFSDSDGTDDSTATVPVGKQAFACFRATNAGRVIAGIPWTYTVDGAPSTQTFGPNCLVVAGSNHQIGDTIHVTASAGGKTSTLDVHVVADPNARTKPTNRAWRAIEGERALAAAE